MKVDVIKPRRRGRAPALAIASPLLSRMARLERARQANLLAEGDRGGGGGETEEEGEGLEGCGEEREGKDSGGSSQETMDDAEGMEGTEAEEEGGRRRATRAGMAPASAMRARTSLAGARLGRSVLLLTELPTLPPPLRRSPPLPTLSSPPAPPPPSSLAFMPPPLPPPPKLSPEVKETDDSSSSEARYARADAAASLPSAMDDDNSATKEGMAPAAAMATRHRLLLCDPLSPPAGASPTDPLSPLAAACVNAAAASDAALAPPIRPP